MFLSLFSESAHNSQAVKEIEKRRQAISAHPLFSEIADIELTKLYMAHQVWCVWDFMALLKSIQVRLVSSSIYWLPPKHAALGRHIYQILSTEETDVDEMGGYSSHFDTYLRAMKQATADTTPIEKFTNLLRQGVPFQSAIASCNAPPLSNAFVKKTIEFAEAPLHISVAAFCYGREQVIPDMFTSFLRRLPKDPNLSKFRWYLKRHITLDRENHGPLSVKLLSAVIEDDEQKATEAIEAAVKALDARKELLDGIYQIVSTQKRSLSL